jgi:hypothetical protein
MDRREGDLGVLLGQRVSCPDRVVESRHVGAAELNSPNQRLGLGVLGFDAVGPESVEVAESARSSSGLLAILFRVGIK